VRKKVQKFMPDGNRKASGRTHQVAGMYYDRDTERSSYHYGLTRRTSTTTVSTHGPTKSGKRYLLLH